MAVYSRTLTLIACVFLVALPGTAAAGDGHWHSIGRFVEKETTVEVRGARGEAELSCPPGYRLNVATYQLLSGEGFALPFERRTGANFGLYNYRSDTEPVTLRVKVICVLDELAAAVGRHRHGLAEVVKTVPVEAAPYMTTELTVACPRGYFPVSGSLEESGDGRLTRSLPSDDGSWLYTVQSVGDPVQGRANTRCLNKRTKRARRHRHRLLRKVVRKRVTVPAAPIPQRSTVTVMGELACPAGYTATGVGHEYHPYTYLASFYSNGETASSSKKKHPRVFDFLLLNQSTAHTAELALVCLGNRTARAG